MSTNTQHLTLKSLKMSDNDIKKSNHRLMNVMGKYIQSDKRQKKETLRFYDFRHLPKREIFHSYINYRKLFTFFSFPDQSSCITSGKM